jgi:hypothetical protein
MEVSFLPQFPFGEQSPSHGLPIRIKWYWVESQVTLEGPQHLGTQRERSEVGSTQDLCPLPTSLAGSCHEPTRSQLGAPGQPPTPHTPQESLL